MKNVFALLSIFLAFATPMSSDVLPQISEGINSNTESVLSAEDTAPSNVQVVEPQEVSTEKTEQELQAERLQAEAEAIRNVAKKYSGTLDIYASSAIAIDVETGEILYQKNAHKRLPQASLTKITTALLALENGNMQDEVKITSAALNLMSGSSTAGLKAGEVLTLGELMYALMLPSGNDAANAIAIHLGGSTWSFAEEMNKKVVELGLNNTNFKNAHGLPSDDHFSSAYDIAQMTLAALQYDDFYTYAGADTYKVSASYTNYAHTFKHAHKMLRHSIVDNQYYNSYAVAGKTGWTPDAGNCFMTVFDYAGRKVVVVVMKSNGVTGAPYFDTNDIFNYSYSILRQANVIS